MKAGSLPWLLRHEIRVRWRELLGDTSVTTVVLVGLAAAFFAHVVLWQLISNLRDLLTPPFPPESVFLAAALLVVMVPFGIMVGINHSVVALFERGDLDLLVSSPVPSGTIFAARLLGVAAGVFVTIGVFVLPVASLGLLMGTPQLLGVVPLLLSVSLVTASLGMLVTLGLVRLMGPRRARTTSQVLAAAGGLVLFLLTQVPALLGEDFDMSERVETWVAYFAPGGPLAADSAIWLPARTLFLDPLGTFLTLAFGAIVAWGAVATLHRAFANGIGLADAPTRRRARAGGGGLRFRQRGAVSLLLFKEWRLMLRDPFLISQTLLQVVYLLPAAYIVFFNDRTALSGFDLGSLLAVLLVVTSGTLAASLARIAVAGEAVPDLVAASPVPHALVLRSKALAALLPVWVLAAPLAVGLVAYDAAAGVLAIVFVIAATLTATSIRLMNPVRTARQDLFRRNKALGDPVLGILEGFSPLVWGVASYMVATSNPLGIFAVGGALLIPLVCYLRARAKGYLPGVHSIAGT